MKKAISIAEPMEKCKAALGAAIREAEGRAKVRTIDADDVAAALHDLEKRLGISKKSMEGLHVTVDLHAHRFSNAYKGIPESTIFDAEYRRGAWRVVDIRRDRTRAPSNAIVVRHTEQSRQAIIDKYTNIEL